MADTPETLLSVAFARQSLLTHLVRLLLRERAFANNQTRDDIMKWAEETKKFFESEVPSIVTSSYLTAAVDDFFKVLAADVERDRKNP
jgi:hypothetical protein